MEKDRMNLINQRKIEAEIASALIKGFEQEVGSEKALEIASKTIRGLARDAGKRIAETNGSNDMKALAKVVKDMWSKDNALEIELLEETSDKLFFNVKQCCYAEMYINSGLSDFGYCLSCNRDAAFVNGFNPDIIMKRTKTIMEGAICCDFRFYINKQEKYFGRIFESNFAVMKLCFSLQITIFSKPFAHCILRNQV